MHRHPRHEDGCFNASFPPSATPNWGTARECSVVYVVKSGYSKIMETKILKVVKQGEAFMVDSQKAEGGKLAKCNILLQEMGGKYENQYAATMLGNAAQLRFLEGDMVAARLRFTTREYNGQVFQDILVTDVYKMKN